MAAKKISLGLVIHISVTVIGVVVAFLIGLKAAGGGKDDIDKQFGELKGGIEANLKHIEENKKLGLTTQRFAETNRSQVADSLRKVNTLASTVSRELSKSRSGSASTGTGMNYVNSVLGLKWVTRFSDGHRYCLIPYPLPWKHAQDFAKKVGGSLVVINDEAENKWIVEKFGSSTEYWIGLTDERDEAKWLWVDDSDMVYKNWATGEPDNYKKMQHYAIMNKQAAKGAEQPGKWNDIIGNEIKIGIIEAGR